MRHYLFDTNAVSDVLNDRHRVRARAVAARRAGHRIGTCPPVTGELYFGAEKSDSRERSLRQLRLGLREFRTWPYDRTAAEEFGRLHALLERSGRLMQIVDIQVAAIAFVLGDCVVVSCDSDVHAVPGLAVGDWRS